MRYSALLLGLSLFLPGLSALAASPYGQQPNRYYAQPPAGYYRPAQQQFRQAYSGRYQRTYYRSAPGYFYRQPYQPAPVYQQQSVKSKAPAPIATKPAQSKLKQKLSNSKLAFLQKIAPLVHNINKSVTAERTELLRLIQQLDRGYKLNSDQTSWLKSRFKTYRVKGDIELTTLRDKLLPKIDVIPVELALAQAANESAWGKSRFAKEAQNLFGVWTYDESKGIVPRRRAKGAKHLIRKYETTEASIRHYITLLNSHPAYKSLRDIRMEQRNKQQQPDGIEMAAGLIKYSAKGKEYVAIIRSMINNNNLTEFRTNQLG